MIEHKPSEAAGAGETRKELDKLWYLRKIKLFTGLSPGEMDQLNRISVMRNYQKGQTVYLPDATQARIFLLKRGRVKIFKLDSSGREMVLTILKEGEVFGDLTSGSQDKHREFATALEPVLVCIINRKTFFSFIQDKPSVVLSLNRLLSRKVYELEMMVEELTFKPVKARLCSLLLKLDAKFGQDVGGKRLINLPMTHSDIASMVGATRESATIALNDLKRSRTIDFRKKRILITQPDRLRHCLEL